MRLKDAWVERCPTSNGAVAVALCYVLMVGMLAGAAVVLAHEGDAQRAVVFYGLAMLNGLVGWWVLRRHAPDLRQTQPGNEVGGDAHE